MTTLNETLDGLTPVAWYDPVDFTRVVSRPNSKESEPMYDQQAVRFAFEAGKRAERAECASRPVAMKEIYKTYTESDLYDLIQGMVYKFGSQATVADRLGISTAYLNDYLSGRRAAGAKILAALELRRVISYESTTTDRPA
jgi:hypothetical protein